MEILYKDKNLVVCIKPVGVDSEKALPQMLKEELNLTNNVYTVHRLDLNVGGVMVYALNSKTAAYLSREMQDGNFSKEYVACVHGIPPDEQLWTDLLFKDSKQNKVFVVKKMRSGVKSATLEYKLLHTDNQKSYVRVKLHTGRSHQIRVQFSSRGFPIVGDRKYGSSESNSSPMLFSASLSFPYKEETCTFSALPEWFK